MYLCGPGKHNCQPFCGPEGRFYCSDSVCSLWPAPCSYLCVSVRILCVCWKLSAAEQVKTDCCHTPAVVSTLLTPLPVSCPLTTPLHYIYFLLLLLWTITCVSSSLLPSSFVVNNNMSIFFTSFFFCCENNMSILFFTSFFFCYLSSCTQRRQ